MSEADQRLPVVRDFKAAVRFVFFETEFPGSEYATHGGTMFIVNFRGKPFGITCCHVKQDFEWRALAVTDTKFGNSLAGIKAVYYPSHPLGGAIDSDVRDLAIIEFTDDVGPSFFSDTAFPFEPGTIAASSKGDQLEVNGAFKAESTILDGTITPKFGLLEFQDDGHFEADPVLRRAIASYPGRSFESLTGFSGSPVFNVRKDSLAGIAVRGSMNGDYATIYYVEIGHVQILLNAASNGYSEVKYSMAMPANKKAEPPGPALSNSR